MAVYTSLSFEESSDWFENTFDLGQVTDLVGISGGIENTNYFLTATKNNISTQYVLTIFERLEHAQLPYYLHLMSHLIFSMNGFS